MRKQGRVFLVGAGPGDPGLITERGARLLADCDAVVHDALVNPALLTRVRPGTRLIDAGKRGGGSGGARGGRLQERINSLLVGLARRGLRVVRLKGGDPFLLARGAEEAEHLARRRVPFEVVPGVSSVTAVPAYAGMPLTHRGVSSMVTIVTGRRGEGPGGGPEVDWEGISPQGTLVVLMGASHFPEIAGRLLIAGWPETTPVAAVEWATAPRQKIITGLLGRFAGLSKSPIRPPAVIVIGRVAARGRRLDWLRFKPLFGRSVVVTRAREQAFPLCRDLNEAGAEVLEVPVIETRPYRDPAWRRVSEGSYDWVVFTSPNGVRYFTEALGKHSRPFPSGAKVCAVGPVTAEAVKARSWPLERTADKFRTAAIPGALGNVKGKRILLARVKDAPPELARELRRRGAHVDTLSAYETVPIRTIPGALRRHLLANADWVTFTSSSTVRCFINLFSAAERRRFFKRARAASIGPVTSATLRKYGVKPAVQAKEYTGEGLVKAILRFEKAVIPKRPKGRRGI